MFVRGGIRPRMNYDAITHGYYWLAMKTFYIYPKVPKIFSAGVGTIRIVKTTPVGISFGERPGKPKMILNFPIVRQVWWKHNRAWYRRRSWPSRNGRG